MHCVDLSQAFIQASWDDLPEKALQIFIRPPVGWDEDPDVVYEVLRPLYGIPSSARALHYTLDCCMTDQGFVCWVSRRACGFVKLMICTGTRF